MFNDNLTINCFVHLYCFFIVNTKIFKVHVIIKIKRDTKNVHVYATFINKSTG